MKRNSEFINCSSNEIDKERKKFMHDKFGDNNKKQLKEDDKKNKNKCRITSRRKKKERIKQTKAKRGNLEDV